MQFPLEGLYQLLSAHTGPVSKPTSPKAGSPVIKSLKQSVLNAKLLLFTHISKAGSPKKVRLLLFSLQVAIDDLRKTVQVEKHPQETEIISQLELLEDFLQENFAASSSALYPKNATVSAEASVQAISVSLTVPQLAVMLRLLVDAEIITGVTNVTHFTAIVAGFIKTSKPVPVSSESLRCKYYSPDKPSLSIVREHLLKMMRLVGSYTP
ncbi:MAG TPA: hypothetical protein PKM63_21160 [Panacibacter sp.]|nr:hypothetical protein [Panacibacter sp.]HNP46821.1 hypothetical protein [Panacibacter sp.]